MKIGKRITCYEKKNSLQYTIYTGSLFPKDWEAKPQKYYENQRARNCYHNQIEGK